MGATDGFEDAARSAGLYFDASKASYLVAVTAVKHADEHGDDAVAAHEFAVVRRGGHGLEGEGHLLEVTAAEHGDERVDALHLGLDGLVLAVAGPSSV